MEKKFTLIELMVIVVIIGILEAILMLRLTGTVDRASEKTTAKNIKSLKMARDMYGDQGDDLYSYSTTNAEAEFLIDRLRIDRSREEATRKNLKNIYAATLSCAQRAGGRFDWAVNTTGTGTDNIWNRLTGTVDSYGCSFL